MELIPSYNERDLKLVRRICSKLPGWFGSLAESEITLDTTDSENDTICLGNGYQIMVVLDSVEQSRVFKKEVVVVRSHLALATVQTFSYVDGYDTDYKELSRHVSMLLALRAIYAEDCAHHLDNIIEGVCMEMAQEEESA